MKKVAEGFHWKVVASGPCGPYAVLYFEHRHWVEQACYNLNRADGDSEDGFAEAA